MMLLQLAVALLVVSWVGAEAAPRSARSDLKAVPFTQVRVQDRFFAPRIEANRTATIPACLQQCEQTGRISNFAVAGGLEKGQFRGIYYDDSDVYKVIEGIAYSLQSHPDPELERRLDGIIAKIAAAQRPDGYLNTYHTLVAPDKRWTNLPVMHELYCAGHLFEAAVAHYQATGKRTLLNVATRFADHIDSVFGEDRKIGVSGHEEIELALLRLFRVTGDERYRKLSQFFIDHKGKGQEYNQDNVPVRQQSEIVGHAVRAMYLYTGVADLASLTGDPDLIATMDRIWRDVTQRKMYITGGIGPSAKNEGFTVAYDLPNESAYCETCASIGMALWNHRLLMLHGDGKYADVLERVLYNGLLSGVALDGKTFFYVNPLASRGNHHRQPWYGTACCPTNVVRFVPSIGGYAYATDSQGLRVNLYMASTMETELPTGKVTVKQETDYPWSGAVTLRVSPEKPATFSLSLRIPAWCQAATLKVNGQSVDASKPEKGYVTVTREWRRGDVVKLDLPMEIRRVVAHPSVRADEGRVALMRGPLVYCLEGVDNEGSVRDIALPDSAKLRAVKQPNLLGGVVVLKGKALRAAPSPQGGSLYWDAPERVATEITAVPYYAWDNRAPGEMAVWLPRTVGLAELKPPPTLTSSAKPSASHLWQQDTLEALNDGREPSSSQDGSIPRFSWWDHKGTTEWVSLTLDRPQTVSQVEVYWYDDSPGGGCRLPASWRVLYRDGDQWRPVEEAVGYGVAADRYNSVLFRPVRTGEIRLEAQLQPGFSAGILEMRLG